MSRHWRNPKLRKRWSPRLFDADFELVGKREPPPEPVPDRNPPCWCGVPFCYCGHEMKGGYCLCLPF